MRQLDHLVEDRVAMDHHLGKGQLRVEKFLADPAQVAWTLFVQRDSRPNTRMDEDIVPRDDLILERFEKPAMQRRYRRLHQTRQFVVVDRGVGFARDAVAEDRLDPADPGQEAEPLGIALKRRQEDFLVIAEQEAGARPLVAQGDETIDHFRRIGPAIDEIAEEDQLTGRTAARAIIGVDALQQSLEQVEAAVNIADCIDAASLRHTRRGGRRIAPFGAEREKFPDHGKAVRAARMNMEYPTRKAAIAGARIGRLACALLAIGWLGTAPVRAAAAGNPFEAIRETDTTLAQIGFRLATANAPLCDRLEPGLGLVLHTPSQYARGARAEAVRHFSFDGPVGVEAVIAGSPAERAGLHADDSLSAIGTARFAATDPQAEASTAALIDVAARVAALQPDAPLTVEGRRAGASFTIPVQPVPACRSRFELAIATGFDAQADGDLVQISSRFLETYPEDQIAAVVAHELSHNILRHRERLEAVGVSFGMLSGLGRNVRYFRETELQADILSVALLANAGYDPQAAVRFWRDFGPKHAGGILRSRSHPAWRDRIATLESAITALGPERPVRPAILGDRNSPLKGDWEALIARHAD